MHTYTPPVLVTVSGVLSGWPAVVEAQSKSALLDAKKRLDVVTWSNRLKEPATHFISIPLPTLADSFVSFRTSVLASCSKVGLLDEVSWNRRGKILE